MLFINSLKKFIFKHYDKNEIKKNASQALHKKNTKFAVLML